MTVFQFALKRSLKQLTNIIFLCGIPLLAIFLPTSEFFPLPVGYHFYGILLFFTSAKLVSVMMEDRVAGILLRIGVSPVTHLQYLWQNLLAYTLLLMLQSIIVIVGGLIYGHNLIAPGLLFLIYVVFTITAISFSLAWFALFRQKETAMTIMFGLVMLMFMAGGLFYPAELMPEMMQRIVVVLPTYWLAEAQWSLANTGQFQDLVIPLIVLVLFSTVFLLTGSRRTIA